MVGFGFLEGRLGADATMPAVFSMFVETVNVKKEVDKAS